VAYLVVMVGNALAVAGLIWGFTRPRTFRPLLALVVAFYLALAVFTAEQPATTFVVTVFVSQFLMGWGWAVLATLTAPATGRGLGRTTASLGAGMTLFLLLAFLYYISLDIAIPFPRASMPLTGVAILGAALLYAASRMRGADLSPWKDKTALIPAGALLLVPLVYWAGLGPPPAAEKPTGFPVRAMTFNIHSAYNTDGQQDPEAIAQVIEASGAEVVALQEISRGWLINGSTDLPTWLSRRLDMPVLFRGTTGPMWGNAILSRYPILDHGWGKLPLEGTLLARGYLWAKIDVGGLEPLLVIATHLHHIERDNDVRLAQVAVLLDFWGGRPYTLLMGDLNAEPGWPEIDPFDQAGLIDSWAEAGAGQGYTWPAYDPYQRIDWIWHTSDLAARDAETIDSTASDHRPVLTTMQAAP
jgi:endonuclease/exonuclease/phosphatase family metal-dependent hydrolase